MSKNLPMKELAHEQELAHSLTCRAGVGEGVVLQFLHSFFLSFLPIRPASCRPLGFPNRKNDSIPIPGKGGNHDFSRFSYFAKRNKKKRGPTMSEIHFPSFTSRQFFPNCHIERNICLGVKTMFFFQDYRIPIGPKRGPILLR